jgi:hypothetical protein
MQVIRKWKNGKEDIFSILELQNSIEKPSSDPYEPKKYNSPKIDFNNVKDEEYSYIENKDIFVSNYGRVRNNNEIVPQKEKRNNPNNEREQTSFYVTIPKKYSGYVYRLVAEAFFEKINLNDSQVHHISGNALDNRAVNLIYVTKEQHGEIEPYYFLTNLLVKEFKELDWNNLIFNNITGNIIINISRKNLVYDFCYKIFKYNDVIITLNRYIDKEKKNIEVLQEKIISGDGIFECNGKTIKKILITKIIS